MTSDHHHTRLECVASTGTAFCKTIEQYHSDRPDTKRRRVGHNGGYSNFFREGHFSSDGTTIVTHCEDECLRTFVLPPELLETSDEPSKLEPYDEIQSPTNTLSYSLYPHFDLQSPATTLVLAASKDVPLALRNVLHYQTLHASYLLLDAATEAYVTPHSLTWTPDGSHFVAGSKDQVSLFDASREGAGPTTVHKTAPGRTAKKLYGAQDINDCKGIVSALTISPDGVLAAGTRDRNVGLFDQYGLAQCSTAFSVAAEAGQGSQRDGSGVTHLRWSPCGKYLLVAERQSDSIQVFDVRDTHRRVCCLTGRRADTTQKLGIDVVSTADGSEVWAGGVDGGVRMWRNPGSLEGAHLPDEVEMLHSDPVSSAVWHPGGDVLATCSGRRCFPVARSSDSDSERTDDIEADEAPRSLDNTLRIWSR